MSVLSSILVLADKSADLFSILPVLVIVTLCVSIWPSVPELMTHLLLLQSFFLLLVVLYQRLFEGKEGNPYSILQSIKLISWVFYSSQSHTRDYGISYISRGSKSRRQAHYGWKVNQCPVFNSRINFPSFSCNDVSIQIDSPSSGSIFNTSTDGGNQAADNARMIESLQRPRIESK